jgi:hypothetical protein
LPNNLLSGVRRNITSMRPYQFIPNCARDRRL